MACEAVAYTWESEYILPVTIKLPVIKADPVYGNDSTAAILAELVAISVAKL